MQHTRPGGYEGRKGEKMYGISIKPGDQFSANVYKFGDVETARKWLHTEEYDFREREISEDAEYIMSEYEDYLPSYEEIESLDDIAIEYEDYLRFNKGDEY